MEAAEDSHLTGLRVYIRFKGLSERLPFVRRHEGITSLRWGNIRIRGLCPCEPSEPLTHEDMNFSRSAKCQAQSREMSLIPRYMVEGASGKNSSNAPA